MIERRNGSPLKSSPLPSDFLKMVTEVFTTNFEVGLQAVAKEAGATATFRAQGAVYPNEVLLSVSLVTEGQMAATTAHASADFDPKASAPTLEELIGACVDGIGQVFGSLLDFSGKLGPEKLEAITSGSLSALSNVPFDWTGVKVEKRTIFLLVDKSNPQLDDLASDWLEKNDPQHAARLAEEAQETEKLFVTGKEAAKKPTRH